MARRAGFLCEDGCSQHRPEGVYRRLLLPASRRPPSTRAGYLVYVRHHTSTWLEITTLLIPDTTITDVEIRAICHWIAHQLGPDVPPFHSISSGLQDDANRCNITGHPRSRAIDCPAEVCTTSTPAMHHREGETTYCATCQAPLIARDRFNIDQYTVTATGTCPHCGSTLARTLADTAGHFGPRRIPIRLGRTPEARLLSYCHSAVGVLQPHDIVFAQISARLHLDDLERHLARIG